MPRTARKKSEECMYHIMSRSISEIDLFRCNKDKEYYLALLARYVEKNHCKLYAYCLMNNHVHLFINPQGYDISSFMLALNCAYVSYYNRRYNRHGHLFQGRFASKIVDNDTYSLTLSAYIHNNVKDLPEYEGREESYRYSSFGIYTGIRKDTRGVLDTEFLLRILNSNKRTAQVNYRAFAKSMRNTGVMAEVDNDIIRAYTDNEYKNEKQYIIRQDAPDKLLLKISQELQVKPEWGLSAKYSRKASEFRAFITYVMRVICGYTYKKICVYIGNMSMSGITRLSNVGFKLLCSQISYQNAFKSIISSYS